MSSFRARKEGRALTSAEKYAEREYEARRRKRRVQVMLTSEEEVVAWRRAARDAGYRTAGEWVCAAMTDILQGDGKTEIESWRARALKAEQSTRRLEQKVALLESVVPENAFGRAF